MRLIEFLTILCLPLLAGRDLTEQGKKGSMPIDSAETFCRIVAPMMSQDGAWLFLRERPYMSVMKNGEKDENTIMIFDLGNTGNAKSIATRHQVRDISFVGNTHLLLSTDTQTELLNLKEQTSIYFEGVKKFQVLQNKKQFLLHYNKMENNRLELRNNCSALLKTINNVSLFSITENGHIYSVTDNEKNDTSRTIYSTTQKVLSLNADPGEKGLIIHEQNPENNTRDVLYLDLTTKICYSLKEVLPIPFSNSFSKPLHEGSAYYLNLCIDRPKVDSAFVDIWNGNDNKLEEKFHSLTTDLYYIWEPVKGKVQRIGTDTLINNANIGSERYFLSSDPYLLQDYTKPTLLKINVFDRLNNIYSIMDTIIYEMHVSPDGNYILYPKNRSWYIYYISTGMRKTFGNTGLKKPCFNADGKMVMFGGEDGLWSYDPQKNKLTKIDNFKGFQVNIVNASSTYTLGYKMYEQKIFDDEKPLILELYDNKKNKTTYLLWKNDKSDTVIPLTGKYIQYLKYDDKYKYFCYLEEDYNLPQRMVYKAIGQKGKVIYQSNEADTGILSLKQEIISFTNSSGIPLKGTLYYPLHYNASHKYPMVVHIYEEQHYLSNRYPYLSYNDELGFNIRLLLEKGYFVYLPDIVIQGKKGPGIDALDCVNKSLDALTSNKLIDMHKIGLIGHSFGGYETDFIATHSTRFAAYVSGSGHSDIIWYYHAFSYNFFCPEFRRVESGQYKMRVAFSADKTLYFENNPLHYVEKVIAPVLLWSGMEDINVTSDNSMAFYNALRRNGKNAIALFYKGEGHGLQTQMAQTDLTCRILDWFDFFLKGDTGIEWISKGIKVEKKDAP
jgi:dipeptidyl aminopeptidase/acylaminoacyl peptidase